MCEAMINVEPAGAQWLVIVEGRVFFCHVLADAEWLYEQMAEQYDEDVTLMQRPSQ